MKNLILIALSLFLFLRSGTGQTDPLLIKYNRLVFDNSLNDFRVDSEKKYEHDDFGNVIFLEKKDYLPNEEVEIWRGLFYEYDDNQKLKKLKYRQYKEAVDLWITDFWYEYNYDDNGCLINRSTIPNVGGGGVSSKIDYERDDQCRILSISKLYKLSPNEPFKYISYLTRDYHPDGISHNDEEYYMSQTGDSLYLKYEEEYIYNEIGQVSLDLWKANNEEQTFFNYWKNTYEYDTHENLISKKGFKKHHDTVEWDLSTELNYDLEYDENDFLIKSQKDYFSHDTDPPTMVPNFSRTIYYENSCEGFTEEINSIYETGIRIKEQNIYQGLNECFELEEKDLSVDVYPNPSEGLFEIASPIFKTGDTKILVYSMDGKVLLQKKEISRFTTSSIDLSLMQNGFYLLQLRNGDHFVTTKIVIVK